MAPVRTQIMLQSSASASATEPVTAASGPLVILGMHRSGTSCLASVLHAGGLCLGERLLAADPTNPAGHFEDLEILGFHERVLQAHGLSATGFVGPCRLEPNGTFRAEAEALVETRRQAGKPWGWKEPRTVLLLPFWRSIVPDSRFVAVFRPPWDVVDSLFRRGDREFVHNPSLALTVWMAYNEAIRDFARAHPADVIVREVGQVISEPARLCTDIRERFGIPLALDESPADGGLLGAAPAEWRDLLRREAPECEHLLEELRSLAGVSNAGEGPVGPSPEPLPDLHSGLAAWQRARRGAMLALREPPSPDGQRAAEPSEDAVMSRVGDPMNGNDVARATLAADTSRTASDAVVLVGVPVFQGAATVAETLRSIAQQEHTAFRVVLSVDGPDERSIEACRPFLDDPRFELHVQPSRLGWAGNVNWLMQRCIEVDEAAFFCFWQQDDLAATSYLSTLVAHAERHPHLACVVSDLQWFGARIDRVETPSLEGFALERVLWQVEAGSYAPFLGLVRRSAIEAVGPVRITPHESALEDQVWLARVAAHGPWHRVPGTLYFKRAHRDATHWHWEHERDDRTRRGVWIEWGVGMLEAALAAAAPSDSGRLFDIVLDRLTVPQPGRWLFFDPAAQGAEALEAFRADFAARARARLGVVGAAAGLLAAFQRCMASTGRGTLYTAVGEAGVAALGAGWSGPEAGGVWSDGPRAMLHLPIPADGRWEIELHAHPYGTTDHDRLITLRQAGAVVARHVHYGRGAEGIAPGGSEGDGAAVLRGIVEGDGPLVIDMPWATSPAALGHGDDPRRLGICLHRVVMTRLSGGSAPRPELIAAAIPAASS